ncbi:hypothetical protein [Cupriavidus numazuensis]|nr:hypothetical protein [Cupriavidus numazuensis]
MIERPLSAAAAASFSFSSAGNLNFSWGSSRVMASMMMDHGGVDNGTTVVHTKFMNHGGPTGGRMKQQDSQMKIRLPLGLKFWLVSQARLNRRSVNAEVVYQLESVKTKENTPAAATVEALDAK